MVSIAVSHKIKSVTMLGLDQEISWKQTKNILSIDAPNITPKQIPSNFAVIYKILF